MQCGAGARPEYAGKRLVAVKRMKKRWEGGWDECKRLKELEVRTHHPLHRRVLTLLAPAVPARNTISPYYYPPLRLLPIARHEGALLRLRVHGG